MDTKMDVKKVGKKYVIDGVLWNCTIAPSLAPDCSPKLRKNYTKSDAKSSFCCNEGDLFYFIFTINWGWKISSYLFCKWFFVIIQYWIYSYFAGFGNEDIANLIRGR